MIMTERSFPIAVALLLFATSALAQDHLRPQSNPYDPAAGTYYQVVGQAMHEAFDQDVRALVITDSMFAPQAAFGVKEDHGEYKLFGLSAKTRMLEHPAEMKRCEAALDAGLAQRILQVWKSSLLKTRFVQPGEERVVGSDGTDFSFSMRDGGQDLAGEGWALDTTVSDVLPDEDTSALINIANIMAKMCTGSDAKIERLLDRQVSQLQARLDAEKPK